MKTLFVALLLVGVSAAYTSIPDDYNELAKFLFGSPSERKIVSARSKRETEEEYVNRVCECVPYYQCNYNGTMNVDGEGIIDIRTGFVGTVDSPTSTRRACDHYLSVCCLAPEMLPGRDQGQGQSNGSQGSVDIPGQGGQNGQGGVNGPPNQGGHGGQDVPTNQGDSNEKVPPQGGQPGVFGKPHVNRGCGYRNPNGVGFRITGNYNNEANFAEFPWMVAILKQENVKGNDVKLYQCGGSLIHKRVVLTAAHCVYGKSASNLTIRAGEWDTQTTDEPLSHQDRQVSVVATHPLYKTGILHNDYALLILSTPVDLADNVELVCLPEETERYDHVSCFATGWGKNEFGEKGKYQVILKSIELPTVPHDRCQDSLRSTRLGKYFKLDQSFMCAGGINGLDTCTGDGGSPLVCPLLYDSTRYTQAGIVAWGIGCGQDNVPGVYADVTKGRRWIDEVLTSYNIDSISYSPGGNNNYPPVQG